MNDLRDKAGKLGIYSNLTQEELEVGYDARATVNDFMEFVDEGAEIGKAVYRNYHCLKDVSFGDTQVQVLDVFTAKKGSPILFVIHGGYWRAMSKEQHVFMVPAFNQHNIACVSIDYGLAPEYCISQMVDHVRSAISWVYNHAREFNADPDRIVVVGSSAGAHLASMLLVKGWHEEYAVPVNVIKGMCLQSGIFDLTPLVDCRPNEWLKSDLTKMKENSPTHNQLISTDCNVDVFFAEKDTAEFKAQSMEMAKHLKNSGYICQTYEVEDSNHYDLFLHLADEQKKFTKNLIDMFKSLDKVISTVTDIDTFVIDRLPNSENQAEYIFGLDDLNFPRQLNCVDSLIQKNLEAGLGDTIAIHGDTYSWSYFELDRKVNQIANTLILNYGLVPGNRVLLRGANSPYLAAVWLAVVKAGLIAVTTMPLMRARDLKPIIDKAEIKIAICQSSLLEEINTLKEQGDLKDILVFDTDDVSGQLNKEMIASSAKFKAHNSAEDDVAIIAFTSGTTGKPKGCIHFHRDVLSMAICFSENILEPKSDDVFIGSPPLAFTFGLGAALIFPLYAGASTALIENTAPVKLAEAITRFQATIGFTSPTGYNMMLDHYDDLDLSSLRLAVSAGEHLNSSVYNRWKEMTGIAMINGIGSTEMIHIFVSTSVEETSPNLTGRVIPGYQACVMDENYSVLAPGNEGLLAIKGPTGCKYLDDERQSVYVHNGWNVTGDIFYQDDEERFWFRGRSDDMIVSSGYNISSIEVEVVVNEHPKVVESAVIGVSDIKRGKLIKAYIVLKAGIDPSDELVLEIQNFVKNETSPYKYPRAIQFVDSLPKTETGKIQRFKLS